MPSSMWPRLGSAKSRSFSVWYESDGVSAYHVTFIRTQLAQQDIINDFPYHFSLLELT